jgi:hypothetical protein
MPQANKQLSLGIKERKTTMGYTMDEFSRYMVNLARFRSVWIEWAHSKPSPKHPIKYLKWYFSEPDFDKWIKENNK